MNTHAKVTALLILCAATSGCSTTSQQYALPYEEPVFLDFAMLEIERDQLHRYACLTGAPLLCNCAGKLTRTCECRCAFY